MYAKAELIAVAIIDVVDNENNIKKAKLEKKGYNMCIKNL